MTQMKKRLEEAMNGVYEAEEIIPLLKEAIAKFELVQSDLFEVATIRKKAAPDKAHLSPTHLRSQMAKYQDDQGNTWGGKGRRPNWLNEALEQGMRLEDFLVQGKRVRSAK
jgi:DNA-binding protein H-NS